MKMDGRYRAALTEASSLSVKAANSLCQDYLYSFCRYGDQCPRSHEICLVQEKVLEKHNASGRAIQPTNVLCMEERLTAGHEEADFDGPGTLSVHGARHDNDHLDIKDISILPTIDEVLSLRPPYIPAKDSPIPVDPTDQRNRLLEISFRQFRYDNIESIIDVCYHAAQQCVRNTEHTLTGGLKNRNETPKGNQYYLYQDIEFLELGTKERKGVTIPVSFTCPKTLRGGALDQNGRLEEGMLAAFIGIDTTSKTLSITFMEILSKRSATMMKLRTGHEDRAAVTLTFTESANDDAVRRLLYNASGLLSEYFVLVEFPKTLLAGFQWCLKRLQHLSGTSQNLAFASQLGGSHEDINLLNPPPAYALKNDFDFNLQSIRSGTSDEHRPPLRLNPLRCLDIAGRDTVLKKLHAETTLDNGQAAALCESLSRRLAFTQGPPGTGKTFLGVAIVKVLLESRPTHDPRPLLVVCMTNHALDSFLEGLLDQGIVKLTRLGRGSKEEWTQKYDLIALVRRTQQSLNERQTMKLASAHCDSVYAEMMALAPCIVSKTVQASYMVAPHKVENNQDIEEYDNFDTSDNSGKDPPDTIHKTSNSAKVQDRDVCSNYPQRNTPQGITKDGKTISWIAIRDHLEEQHPLIYNSFAQIESSREHGLSVARLSRKASGFAFEFWLHGGDLKDIQSLLDQFESMLGRNKLPLGHRMQDRYDSLCEKLTKNISANAQLASKVSGETSQRGDIWSLSLEARQELVRSWCEAVGPYATPDKLEELHRRYLAAVARRNILRRSVESRCLLQQDVIGVTTTGCAREWELLRDLNMQTVMCEEAGEVIEAQTLCTLFPTIEHAVFIGDPQQLRPQVSQQIMSLENSPKYRLDESLFERLTSSKKGVLPLAMSHLNVQRRMHPLISELMTRTLYPKLEDHPSTHMHPEVAGMAHRVYWFDHTYPEDGSNPKSYSNSFEVDMTTALVKYLVNTNEYDFGDIAVLTPYNGQLAALRQRLASTCRIWLCQADKENLEKMGLLTPEQMESPQKTETSMSNLLRLATVDNFQGEEAKVVLLSTVRSNAEDRVGFLKTSNRINVGCSRARDGFYIIGNASLMRNVDMWNEIVTLLEERSMIGNRFKLQCHRHPFISQYISLPQQFLTARKCPAKCQDTLACGHKCLQPCHAPSLHERLICTARCEQACESCGQQFTRLCGEPLGECKACVKAHSGTPAISETNFQSSEPFRGHNTDNTVHHILEAMDTQSDMSSIIDRFLCSIGSRMQELEREVHHGEIELSQSREEFRRFISNSPLTGAVNERRIRERTSIFDQVWEHIDIMIGKIIGPFEDYLIRSGGPPENRGPDPTLSPRRLTELAFRSDSPPTSSDTSSISESLSVLEEPNIPMTDVTRHILREARRRGAANLDDLDPSIQLVQIPNRGNNTTSVKVNNLHLRTRLLSLHFRHRVVVLNDSLYIIKILNNQAAESDHSRVFTAELKTMTGNQASENIETLTPLIESCDRQGLKRLEVELRLLQISFVIIARHLDRTVDIDQESSLRRAKILCRQYPDTAGLFLEGCSHVYRALKNPMGLRPQAIFTRSTGSLWYDWGDYRVGHLTQCSLGHLYSSATFRDCPECGRKVEIATDEATEKEGKDDKPMTILQEDAFLAKMREMVAGIYLEEVTADPLQDASKQPVDETVPEMVSTISHDGPFDIETEGAVKGLQEDAFLMRMRDMGMCA